MRIMNNAMWWVRTSIRARARRWSRIAIRKFYLKNQIEFIHKHGCSPTNISLVIAQDGQNPTVVYRDDTRWRRGNAQGMSSMEQLILNPLIYCRSDLAGGEHKRQEKEWGLVGANDSEEPSTVVGKIISETIQLEHGQPDLKWNKFKHTLLMKYSEDRKPGSWSCAFSWEVNGRWKKNTEQRWKWGLS